MAMQFAMKYKEPELIVPSKPTPQEIKQLSVVDKQKCLRFQFPMIMFYEHNPRMDTDDPVGLIKYGVAEALVYYYPYTGRLIEGTYQTGLMVNCTAEGVLFREAMAEIDLDQLRGFIKPPFVYSEQFLLDDSTTTAMLGNPLMLIQLTRLKCGGIVLAIRLNHIMGDAFGLAQFLKAVGQISSKGSSSAPSPFPVWDRELLNARNPPRETCVHPEYEIEQNNDHSKGGDLIRKAFVFGAREIKAMKKFLPPGIGYATKFDLITAFVWRSRTIALQLDPEDNVSLVLVINIRAKSHLNLPMGYYGNSCVLPAAVSKVKLLCNNSLGYAVELVKKAKARVNEDFINSSIDFIGMHKNSGISTLLKNLLVSDPSRSGIDEVDYGWGKPMYGGTMDGGPYPNYSVYARSRNGLGEDGVVVPICLPLKAMEKFQEIMDRMSEVSVETCYRAILSRH